MKRPLKAREVAFVLIPALGLGGFAWYQKRVESVGGPRRSDGLFVARIEMKPAKGRFQAMGLSHEMKVTIAHSWPRPSWWGNWHSQSGINPLQSAPQNQTMRGMTAEQMLSYGAVLTTTSMSNGKPVIKTQWRDKRIGVPMRDNRLVFSHQMALSQIPSSAGEVTFRGLYLISAQEPLRVTRVVRRAGEVLSLNHDRNPHARILSVRRWTSLH